MRPRQTSVHRTLKLLAMVGAILIVIDLVLFYYPSALELALGQLMQLGHPEWLNQLMMTITHSIYLLGVLVAIYALRCALNRDWPSTIVLICSLASLLSTIFIKELFQRPRPTEADLGTILQFPGYSFPSSHAVTATVLTGTLLFVLLQHYPTDRHRQLAIIGGSTYVLLVGWSRVYLGAHYPSDILGGYTLGVGILLLLVMLYRALAQRFPPPAE